MNNRLITILDQAAANAVDPKLLEQKAAIDAFASDVYKLLEIDFSIITLNDSDKMILTTFIDLMKNNSISKEQAELLIRSNPNVEKIVNLVKEANNTLIAESKNAPTKLRESVDALKEAPDTKYIGNVSDLFSCLNDDSTVSLEDYLDLALSVGTYNIDVYTNSSGTYSLVSHRRGLRPKMTEEELAQIFKKYGYDLEIAKNQEYDSVKHKLKAEYIEKILNKNTPENVCKVFEFFNSIGMKLDYNGNYDTSMLNVLAYADGDTIDNMLNFCTTKGIEIKNIIKEHSSAFKIKREIKNKGGQSQGPSTSNSISEEGSTQDFIANVNYIESLGYDVNTVLRTAGSVFDFAFEHVKSIVEKTIDVLKDYNIVIDDKNKLANVIKSLTWINGCVDPEYVIRRFAELGELNYVLHNPSRLTTSRSATSNLLFYRIKYCKDKDIKYRLGNDPKSYKYEGFITTFAKSDPVTPVTELNKEETTGVNVPLENSGNLRLRSGKSVIGNPYIKALDESYLKENNIYVINNVFISRAKVLKVYEAILAKMESKDIIANILLDLANWVANFKEEKNDLKLPKDEIDTTLIGLGKIANDNNIVDKKASASEILSKISNESLNKLLLLYALAYESLLTKNDFNILKNTINIKEKKNPIPTKKPNQQVFSSGMEQIFLNYLPNYVGSGDSVANHQLIIALDEKYLNGDNYQIGRVFIPRDRTLRNFEALLKSSNSILPEKALLFALTFGMELTDMDFYLINNAVTIAKRGAK